MTAREPGPLPAHSYEWMHCGKLGAKLYTADQMRAFAAQEVEAERERCARICERKSSVEHLANLRDEGWTEDELRAFSVAAESICEQIRGA